MSDVSRTDSTIYHVLHLKGKETEKCGYTNLGLFVYLLAYCIYNSQHDTSQCPFPQPPLPNSPFSHNLRSWLPIPYHTPLPLPPSSPPLFTFSRDLLYVLLCETEISWIFLWWDHTVSPKLSTLDFANTDFAVNYTMTSYTLLWHHKTWTPIWREEDGNQRCLLLFRWWFLCILSRRKIINHHVAGGTRESHPSVQDLQHPRLSKPRSGMQILDTRMWFLQWGDRFYYTHWGSRESKERAPAFEPLPRQRDGIVDVVELLCHVHTQVQLVDVWWRLQQEVKLHPLHNSTKVKKEWTLNEF